MEMAKTVILCDLREVDHRLAELQLSRTGLLEVRKIALSAGADATPFHPANATGTLAYQHGTWALRNEFRGKNWRMDRPNGVEAIWNEALRVRVVFANVDIACDDDRKPKPRSRKGAGAERLSQLGLFRHLPEYALSKPNGDATYYLMVAEDGAAELTRTVVNNGTFSNYIERIYLSDGSDLDGEPLRIDDGDIADDFDPQVIRK